MKKLIKRFAPEFLLQLARSIREARYRTRLTYSGVYASFDEVTQHGIGYEDDEWPATAAQYSRWAIAKNESGFIPSAIAGENALVPFLISISKAQRILDFGGATGFSYIAAKFGAICEIERYVVVEHPKVCAKGREIFKRDGRVEFLEEIPNEKFDLVVAAASLQYVQDYKEILKKLTGLHPKWILLTKLPAGENINFVSRQVNLSTMKFTSWLFNARELATFMESQNYRLIFRGANDGQIVQEKLEPRYILERQCNLLFEATSFAGDGNHGV